MATASRVLVTISTYRLEKDVAEKFLRNLYEDDNIELEASAAMKEASPGQQH